MVKKVEKKKLDTFYKIFRHCGYVFRHCDTYPIQKDLEGSQSIIKVYVGMKMRRLNFAAFIVFETLSLLTAPNTSSTSAEESDETSGLGPITPKEEFSIGTRPFLSSVLEAGDCSENDYLALFSLCLLRAIQINEGELEKIHQRKKWFACNTAESY